MNKIYWLLSFTSVFLSLSAFAGSTWQQVPATNPPDFSKLTTDEIEIYQHGEISTGSLVGGDCLVLL
jgi:hypothetical protein